MLDEVTALAAAGGTAVIAAAGTDAWQELRLAVARWFGRGDAGREQRELERLDRTAGALRTSGSDEAETIRVSERSAWQARFTMLLEDLDDGDRDRAVEQLRALITAAVTSPAPRSGEGGMTVGRDANIQSGNGGFAAGVVNGGVNMNTPHQPERTQG